MENNNSLYTLEKFLSFFLNQKMNLVFSFFFVSKLLQNCIIYELKIKSIGHEFSFNIFVIKMKRLFELIYVH